MKKVISIKEGKKYKLLNILISWKFVAWNSSIVHGIMPKWRGEILPSLSPAMAVACGEVFALLAKGVDNLNLQKPNLTPLLENLKFYAITVINQDMLHPDVMLWLNLMHLKILGPQEGH